MFCEKDSQDPSSHHICKTNSSFTQGQINIKKLKNLELFSFVLGIKMKSENKTNTMKI